MRTKKKYSFVINYGMNPTTVRGQDENLQKELETTWKDHIDFMNQEDNYYKAPKIQMDAESVQLLEIIQE